MPPFVLCGEGMARGLGGRYRLWSCARLNGLIRSGKFAVTGCAVVVGALPSDPAMRPGLSNKAVAADLGVHEHTVGKWRRRFLKDRVDGLVDEPRAGRPRTIEDERVADREHTSELPSLMRISYAVFCLKKKSKK